uniref:SON DNA binding protein n=1 Tax=Oryzias latipes TaxID=8090 RepID=A0A3P9I6E2_ORYLA
MKGQTTGQIKGQTAGQIKGQTAGQIKGQTAGQIKGQTAGQIKGQTAGQIKGQTAGPTKGQTAGPTKGQTAGQIKGQTAGQIKGQTAGQIKGQTAGQIKGQTTGQIKGQIKGQTAGQFKRQTTGQIKGQIKRQIKGLIKVLLNVYKEQLLEIAKANAAAMCVKAGMPVPASLRTTALPLSLPKVESRLFVICLQKCRMIVDSSGELPVAVPHVSDEEDETKPLAAIREQKVINININNATLRPTVRSDAGKAKEFPVSSGSQHRKKVAYGEWVEVERKTEKATAAPKKPPGNVPPPVDITQAVAERIKAQKRLAENPNDISAMCMLSRAQEQMDAWAQSSSVPGLFTGSTGAQVLSSEELSSSGPQAWLKKDQFLRAAPVSGGVGEFLMRKMGWKTGEGLGRNREGTVDPIVIDFKVDRKGLVAEGEKPQKQTGGLVVTKDLMGKHPVSALIELCNKRRIVQPDFVLVHHSGPDHRKNFLFKQSCFFFLFRLFPSGVATANESHGKLGNVLRWMPYSV